MIQVFSEERLHNANDIFNRVPKLRKHTQSGNALVVINGGNSISESVTQKPVLRNTTG